MGERRKDVMQRLPWQRKRQQREWGAEVIRGALERVVGRSGYTERIRQLVEQINMRRILARFLAV